MSETAPTAWQPIETAPMDGTKVLLWCPDSFNGIIAIGRWKQDEYAKRPRPYWSLTGYDTTTSRRCGATHWMPLPQPPETTP